MDSKPYFLHLEEDWGYVIAISLGGRKAAHLTTRKTRQGAMVLPYHGPPFSLTASVLHLLLTCSDYRPILHFSGL
uniref:Uncharacterized protein n=1 Tax=Utricularia reniformis TaxID=192314 RepID=A0A1Y0AZH6_9LAMI|nr:hypothetical protein AEK19_MT0291 [Utricularia reniformis]ART30567.1 hypothetical protein AEK19_MT0291 [Utricularia reniformis]